MTAFITGVAGFIGSHIAEELLRRGNRVIGIDDLSSGYKHNIPDRVLFIEEDICNVSAYEPYLDGVDVVFHNAASKKNICLKDPERDMEVNGIGTLRLLRACHRHNVNKFVHASTGSVYGEVNGVITEETSRLPVSYYGISKMAGESYVQLFHETYGMNTTILRYFHVYGDRQESGQDRGGVVAIFKEKILNGEPIIIYGDGDQSRVFTHVSDIVRANMMSWVAPEANGEIYNCASPMQISVRRMAELLMNHLHKRVPVMYAPTQIGDIYHFNVDATKIKKLGITFTPITSML
jgi:UDP-glucose 4-epimerase